MPTFIAFQKGEKLKEVIGANPAALQVRSLPPSGADRYKPAYLQFCRLWLSPLASRSEAKPLDIPLEK